MMDIEQAQAELTILRGLADSGNDLALVRERIDRLYYDVCGKHLRTCKCRNIYSDALIEIYASLNRRKYTSNTMAQCRLLNGVVLQWGGSHYTNANITDDVARDFLAAFPRRKDWFDILPPAPEKGAETAQEGEKETEQATVPKAKKSAKKRK